MNKNEIEEIVDAIWNDEELQNAIGNYGEWNSSELNKVFIKVKKKYFNP